MNSEDRRSNLTAFLRLLSDEFGWDFNQQSFDNRFLLQKYVFFAQRLGYPLDYGYNTYVFGAYSPSLARDYYSDEVSDIDEGAGLPDSFEKDTFESLVRNKDSRWLEIASTLVLYHEKFRHLPPQERKKKSLNKTQSDKNATIKTVRSIYTTLADMGVVNGE